MGTLGACFTPVPCLQMLRQKIWFEGCSFELQEIYGMEHSQRDGRKTEVSSAQFLDVAGSMTHSCRGTAWLCEPVYDGRLSSPACPEPLMAAC